MRISLYFQQRSLSAITSRYYPRESPFHLKGLRARYSKRYSVCTLSSHLLVSMVIRRGVASPAGRPRAQVDCRVARACVCVCRERKGGGCTPCVHVYARRSIKRHGIHTSYFLRTQRLGERVRNLSYIVRISPLFSAVIACYRKNITRCRVTSERAKKRKKGRHRGGPTWKLPMLLRRLNIGSVSATKIRNHQRQARNKL